MRIFYFGILSCLFVFIRMPVLADVTLPPILSDHAVLQKTARVPVWGRADPGEKVTVALDDQKFDTTTGPDGKWRVNLDLSSKGPGPFELTVEGKNKVILKDIMVGEVWVCSGQSNMEFELSHSDHAADEIARPANPMLRQFFVKKNTSITPLDECEGQWTIAGPDASGSFTAVGYYFGRKLQSELQVPIGLINATWGGTQIEPWISLEALHTVPALTNPVDERLEKFTAFPARIEEFKTRYAEWESKYQRADRPADPKPFASPNADVTAWKKTTFPGDLGAVQDGPGAVWVRRVVTIPEIRNQNLRFDLPPMNDYDAVYWNGQLVGETTPNTPTGGSPSPRLYYILASFLKQGDNTLAIRIFNPNGRPGMVSSGAFIVGSSIKVAGDWLAQSEYSFSEPLSAEARAEYPRQPDGLGRLQDYPSLVFNAMIHALIPYAIKGVVWYQGESNVSRAFQYRTVLQLMIKDWRSRWGEGDFPFYICQLPNFWTKSDLPGESLWAELRESQTVTLALPNTGQAVLIDIGEEGDIHPRNKRDAGERMAGVALAGSYGRTVEYSGPVYESMKVEGDRIRIRFTHADNGLVAKPLPETYQPVSSLPATKPLVRHATEGSLEGFAICGSDGKWKWANARIEEEGKEGAKKWTVVVWSPDEPHPVAIRYAWADNPTCNLYNSEGLPAAPFRTDDFPPATRDKKY